MKKILFFLVLSMGLQARCQLVFINNDSTSATEKFVVESGNTMIYIKKPGVPDVIYTFHQIPVIHEDTKDRSAYKMTVRTSDLVAGRTFEIHHTLFKQSGQHTGYIKTSLDYKDKRPDEVTEDHFKLKTN